MRSRICRTSTDFLVAHRNPLGIAPVDNCVGDPVLRVAGNAVDALHTGCECCNDRFSHGLSSALTPSSANGRARHDFCSIAAAPSYVVIPTSNSFASRNVQSRKASEMRAIQLSQRAALVFGFFRVGTLLASLIDDALKILDDFKHRGILSVPAARSTAASSRSCSGSWRHRNGHSTTPRSRDLLSRSTIPATSPSSFTITAGVCGRLTANRAATISSDALPQCTRHRFRRSPSRAMPTGS